VKSREDLIESIFNAAIAVDDPSTRRSIVDQQCGSDFDMRSRVERLLRSHDSAGNFLEPLVTGPDETVASQTPARPSNEGPGSVVGRYRIVEKIGEGGFGVVYLAEQSEPVRRQVALKIIKLGMDTEQVIARFEAERQALAMMEHPHIARVLEAGATDAGRPYFVMELVKGMPITRYCDESRLSLRERLELFLAVCDAAQHAHLKGIIHRDIKPSNVLVTLQNDRPIPKIIDFGIAKATTQRLTEKTLHTGFAEFIGTPEYMSPDQTGMSGIDIDTRTDIYSLGVLLYEMLTGKTPFSGNQLRTTSFEEIRRIIREDDPPPPSVMIGGLGEEMAHIGSLRRCDGSALLRMVRGDLDWIVVKAMDKDRLRRYQTASEFAADITRHLNHEPVVAGPPSLRYRATKFIRRNRVAVLAGSVVVAAMVTGIALAMAGVVQANRAKEAMGRQVVRSQVMNDFLQSMFASVKPGSALGREVNVQYILDEAARSIAEGALDGQPEVEAALRLTLGDTYQALGEYDVAERQVRGAQAIYSAELGPNAPETLRAQAALAALFNAQLLYEQAESIARQTVDLQVATLGEDHPDTLASQGQLGVALFGQDKPAEAEHLHRRVLLAQKRELGESHVDTLSSIVNLATVLLAQREFAAAETLLRQAYDGERRVLGPEHPDTMTALNTLALAIERQGRPDEAEPYYQQSWEVTRKILGPDHPRTQLPMNNLLRVLATQRKTTERQPILAARLDSLRRAADAFDADAHAVHTYAWELVTCDDESLRDGPSAVPYAQRAVALSEGNDANMLDTLARAHQMAGNLDIAIKIQEQAIAQAKAGGPHNVADLQNRLSGMYLEKGDLMGAVGVSWMDIAEEVGSSLTGDLILGGSLSTRGEALIGQGEYIEAEALLRACLATRRKDLGGDHWLIGETMGLIGMALAGQGRTNEAEALLIEGHERVTSNPKASQDRRRLALDRVIEFYEKAGPIEKAQEWRARSGRPSETGT
jgi:serine/threonine protein kinase/tetratricopeptide (TPR) repeat protein